MSKKNAKLDIFRFINYVYYLYKIKIRLIFLSHCKISIIRLTKQDLTNKLL